MIQDLLEEIRIKIKKINVHNEELKKFNYKMESLLVSIESYSINEDVNNTKQTSNVNKQIINKQIINKQIINKQTVNKQNVNQQIINKQTVNKQIINKQIINKQNVNKQIINSNKENLFVIPDIQKVSKILQKEQFKKPKVEEVVPDLSHTILDTSLLFDTKNDLLNRALSDPNLVKSNKGHLIKIIDLLYQHKEGILWEDIIQKSGVPRYKCIEILNCLVRTDPPLMIKKRDKGFTCYIN